MANITTLGASLYVPATHKNLAQIAMGDLRSVIFCTEDAISAADLPAALANLRAALPLLPQVPGAQRFIRVRNLDVLDELLQMPGIERLCGFVVPKATRHNFPAYFAAVRHTQHLLMPTLETIEVFDDQEMLLFRACLQQPEVQPRILALRIGGNDLLALLGIRRPRMLSIYRTPLGLVIAKLATLFRPYGFALTAPVFEHLDNPGLLAEELAEDLAHGMVGKTAIHPSQVSLIDEHYRVPHADIEVALRVMDATAPAVFKMHDSMCEVATHSAWAHGVVERAKIFGVHGGESAAEIKINLRA
jgi:citrate lyase beta subunit